MDQRTPEWDLARLGSLGASRIGDALSKLKRGDRTAKADDVLWDLIAERITGLPTKRTNALQWGVDHEAEAREAYAFLTNAAVTQVGLIPHPRLERAHASPDALVGDDGGLEIKCPTSATHLRTVHAQAIPEDHLPQLFWCMACSGRQFWDFLSYDPRCPPGLQMFVGRVQRDDKVIAQMEKEAEALLAERDDIYEALLKRAA